MAAPITNEPYAEQTTRAFDALKYASPQQLAQAAQLTQGNQASPEALALAAATNFQQQQRSAGAQAPQQTVYQQRMQQLLASLQPPPQAAPMDGGIAGIGPSVYAAQEAAAQDPMRNAGIGAAPENTPMQQAATGGLIALARGGATPELGTADYPEEEGEEENPDEQVDQELESETGQPQNTHLASLQATPKTRVAPQGDEVVHTPAPGSSAAKEAKKSAFASAVNEYMDVMGPSFSASPELMDEYKGELKSANRDKWINALTQGIGGMLQAQTPYAGQAIGTGLLAGAAGFQQGSKEEADLRKQMMALRLASEKEGHADRRSAVSAVHKTQADAAKLQAQQRMKQWEKMGDWATLRDVAGIKQQGHGAPTFDQQMGWYNDALSRLMQDPSIKSRLTLHEITTQDVENMARDIVRQRVQTVQTSGSPGIDRNALDAITLMGTLGPTGIFGN